MQVSFEVTSEQVNVARLPGTDSETLKRELCIKDHLGRNYEVIVSGVGGDELLGGVPSPMPELADLFLSGDLSTFFAHSLDWCLVDRSPLLEMLWEVARFTFQLYRRGKPFPRHVPNWITPSAEQASTSGGQPRIEQDTRIGLWPSTIENGLTWWALLETLPHLFPSQLNRREHRYPYLDRDLVEFLFRVPRSKLLKPGRRRALMRGALKGLVPEEILERKRKAYVVRKQLLSLQMGYMQVHALFQRPLLAELGLVIPAKVLSALRSVSEGREQHLWRPLMRSISFELWLRSLPEYSSRSG
jgi:asparagine synthase (glutamine-hydrolysing)